MVSQKKVMSQRQFLQVFLPQTLKMLQVLQVGIKNLFPISTNISVAAAAAALAEIIFRQLRGGNALILWRKPCLMAGFRQLLAIMSHPQIAKIVVPLKDHTIELRSNVEHLFRHLFRF
jgi:hypothetical protein